MQIMIASQTYDLVSNGQGVFAVHLARGLARAGFQVTVMMPSDRLKSYCKVEQDVQIQTISALSLAPLYSDVHVTPVPGFQVARLLDHSRPDLIHIQDHYPLCHSVVGEANKRHIPLVGTNHFLPQNMIPYVPLLSRFQRTRSWLNRYIWKMVMDVFNKLDAATAPTITATKILLHNGLRVPVQAISCGVDLKRFCLDPNVDRDAIRSRYRLDLNSTVFLYVGRVDREKRLDVLLNALHLLGRKDIQVAIAGRGGFLEELRKLAQHFELDRQVVFTGFVPHEDHVPLLNSVDFFAMPSDAELQSIATMEAMGTGRPVLAANARALPELVENGVNGYLFESGNAEHAARYMAAMADERDAWGRMSRASLERIEPHRIQNTIDRYIELYRSLIPESISNIHLQSTA